MTLRLSPAVVIVALLIGGTLMGILGALLALPIAAGLQMLVRELRVTLPGEEKADETVRENDEKQEQIYERLTVGATAADAGVIAGVGYGRAGVLELGGSAGFAFASDYRSMNLSPTLGWFVADNLELSAIVSIANIKTGDAQSTLWSALLEPSYHVPFNRSIFGFLGLGAGAAHVSGLGTGFALAPRLGANFMVGRSGVLTPSLAYQYTTIDSPMSGPTDVTVVALTSAVRFNVGYTAMW